MTEHKHEGCIDWRCTVNVKIMMRKLVQSNTNLKNNIFGDANANKSIKCRDNYNFLGMARQMSMGRCVCPDMFQKWPVIFFST